MTNLSVQTFNNNTSKAKFTWDTTGAYVFARITLRVDTDGANWQTAGDSTQPEPAADPPRAVSDEDVYKRWFGLADQDQDGRVTGKDAVEFFGLSGLPKEALSRAWQLADLNRQGYLGKDQFVRALRVIAMV